MRLPRPQIKNCCVHITHRCQERKYLLRYDIDRIYYQKLLYQASRKFTKVRFLNYVITSNHVHLLLWTPRMADISEMMHWLQGTFAQYYNRRKGREGSFWRGRFHPTLIESGRHLSRCITYIDMNMVRARVVGHPAEWAFGGYQEISGRRQRYQVIDHCRLLKFLGYEDISEFRELYERVILDKCGVEDFPEEKYWSSSFAVGSSEWLGNITFMPDYIREKYTQAVGDESSSDTYVINPPQSALLKIWKKLKNR